MLRQNLRTIFYISLSTISLFACSGNKVLPQGQRISVLQEISSLKPDVPNAESHIKVPQSLPNNAWLLTDINAQHTGKNIKVGTDFVRQWKSDFGTGNSKREFLLAKPLVKDDKIYTLDADGSLCVFNLTDGERLWQVDLLSKNSNIKTTSLKGVGMAMAENKIFITTGFGNVVALSSKDGSQIWNKNLQTPLRIAPLAIGEKVFVQSADNRFFALDAKNGDILWDYSISLENTTLVGGAVAGYDPKLDMVIAGFSNGEIQAFNASLGTPLWSDILISNHRAYSSTYLYTIKSSPIIDGEKVYVLGSSNVLAALDIRSGERLWEKAIGGTQTPLLVADTLYLVDNNNQLIAINKNNGDLLWSTNIDMTDKEAIAYAPLMLDGTLVVALSDGYVHTYDAKNGKPLNSIDLDENLNSSPISAEGYIIFTTANAKVLVYK